MYARILDSTDTSRLPLIDLSRRLYWCGTAFFALLSVLLFLINTRHGIGIYPDSVRYMGISERPYDAPLYPWLLMLVSFTGAGLNDGAKAIGLFFVCANTVLIWHLLVRATRNYVYAAVGTAIATLSPQFVTFHSIAMSEPPFLFFLLLTVLALLFYLETDDRAWLKASAVALGLATLARFTAPPLGAAIAICLLLAPQHALARRFGDVVVFALVSAAIFLCWAVMSHIMVGRSVGRALAFYGNMGAREWMTSLTALTAWLLPDQVPFAARLALLGAFFLAVVSLIVIQARKTLQHARGTKVVDALLPTLLALFFIFYMGFMVLSTSAEANLSLTGRYAFPAYVTTVLMATIVLARVSDEKGFVKLLHHGVICVAVLVLGSHVVRTSVRSAEAYRLGIGFASLEWQTSPIVEALRKLPADASIYSNGDDAIAYVLRRKTHILPEVIRQRTGLDDPTNPFEMQLQTLRGELAKKHSYVAFSDNFDFRFYLVTETDLKQRLSLVSVATEADGRIYTLPQTNDEN
jgi:hypothetical protein